MRKEAYITVLIDTYYSFHQFCALYVLPELVIGSDDFNTIVLNYLDSLIRKQIDLFYEYFVLKYNRPSLHRPFNTIVSGYILIFI